MSTPEKKKKHRILIIIIIIAAAIIAACLIRFVVTMNKINHVSRAPAEYVPPAEETFEVTTEEPDTVQPEEVVFDVDSVDMMKDEDIKNILLIGQDRREGESRQRSDSMILCSINTKDDKVTLVSLMRDMYVPIPGYSDNRINAAYAFGGMELLDETIQQDFGITIDGNVEVDFDGFMNALDVVGPIEIELTEREAWYLNESDWFDMDFDDSEKWELQEGVNMLTPPQALAFARIRKIGNSDWERTDRQRRVIMAAFSAIGGSGAAKMLKIADEIFPYITTDLSNSELLSYVKTIAVVGITEMESYRLPVEGHYSSQTINGMSVLVPDLGMNSQILQNYLYGTEIDESKATENYVPDSTEAPALTETSTYEEQVNYTPTQAPAPNPVQPAEPEVTTAPVSPAEPVGSEPASDVSDTDGTDTVPVTDTVEPVAAEPDYVEPAPEPPAAVEPAIVEQPVVEQPAVQDTGTGGE